MTIRHYNIYVKIILKYNYCLTFKIFSEMKTQILKTIVLITSLFFIGCAPVKFSSNPELSGKTGLKFYTVKPFMLVEREPETNRIVKATVLYLPDLAHPQYMAVKDGFGSRKVDIKLTDGAINTFGFTSDTKIAESIDALAALLSKGAAALTDLNTLKNPVGIKAASNTIELYEIVITVEKTTLREIPVEKN